MLKIKVIVMKWNMKWKCMMNNANYMSRTKLYIFLWKIDFSYIKFIFRKLFNETTGSFSNVIYCLMLFL